MTVRLTARAQLCDPETLVPVGGAYVERCWTSIVGPSGVLFMRRSAWILRSRVDPVVDLSELARDLGIAGIGRHSHIRRTIARLERFGFIAWSSPEVLALSVAVPVLGTGHLDRASETVRADHERLLAEHVGRTRQ